MNTLLDLFVFSAKFIVGFGVVLVFAIILLLFVFKLFKAVSQGGFAEIRKDEDKLSLMLVNITEKYKEQNEQFSSFVMSSFEEDSELSEKLSKKARQYADDSDKSSVKERYEKILKDIEESVDRELASENAGEAPASETAVPETSSAADDSSPENTGDNAKATNTPENTENTENTENAEKLEDAVKAADGKRKSLMAEKLKDAAAIHKKCLYVVDFCGSETAAEVKTLREAVNIIVDTAESCDEVLLRLESPGGTVNGYGLCASELERLRAKKIRLTVAVDQVAASGGYLMGCVADKIIAAPFAYIGSIGVVTEFPNFNRVLKKYDVDYEQLTAGEYKRTLSIFGENTEEARDHVKEQLAMVHRAFKQHVAKFRPQVDIDKIANGDYWLAQDAVALGLVDEIKTSDEYIMERIPDMDVVVKVSFQEKKHRTLREFLDSNVLLRRLAGFAAGRIGRFLMKNDNSN